MSGAIDARPILEVEGLSFSFELGGPKVLSSLDARVLPGEMVGLVGPNGAGKSTLLRLAARLLDPPADSIRLLGKAIEEWPRHELARVEAMVPQDTFSPFAFTVEELVLMGRAPHLGPLGLEGPRDVAMVEKLLVELDLEHLARRPIDRLSGGERQRAFIARALAQEPRLLLCDEPAAHLDLRHQSRLFDDLRARIDGEGLSVLVVLHDLNLAAATCDRLLLLREGRIVASGAPKEVLSAEVLEAAYGGPVIVGDDPGTGRRYVLPHLDRA